MVDIAKTEVELAQQNQQARSSKEVMVGGPFGKRVPAKPYTEVIPRLNPLARIFENPEVLVKDGVLEPGMHLAWPRKDDPACEAKIHAGMYIPVRKSEIKSDAALKVSSKGPDDNVHHFNHILVKIPAAAWKELYQDPMDWSRARLAMHEQESMQEIERGSKGLASLQITRE